MCKEANLSEAQTYRVALTAFAESDYDNKAKQLMEDGVNYTAGIFQQATRWGWPEPENIPVAFNSFVSRLKKLTLTNDPVVDCHKIQQWTWANAKETANYYNRLPLMAELLSNPRFFTDRNQ